MKPLKKLYRPLVTALAVTVLMTGCGGSADPDVTERDVKVLRQEVAEYKEMVRRLEDKKSLAASELDTNLTAFNAMNDENVILLEQRSVLTELREDLMSDISHDQQVVLGPTAKMDSILEYYHDSRYLVSDYPLEDFQTMSDTLRKLSYWLSDQGVMPYLEDQTAEVYMDEEGEVIPEMMPWYPVDSALFENSRDFVDTLITVFSSDEAKEVLAIHTTADPMEDKKLLLLDTKLYTRVPETLLDEVTPDESLAVSRIYQISEDEVVFRTLFPMDDPDMSSVDVHIYEERHVFKKTGSRWRAGIEALDDGYLWREETVAYHEKKDSSVSVWFVEEFISEFDYLMSNQADREGIYGVFSEKAHLIPDEKGMIIGYDADAIYADVIIYNGGDLPVDVQSGEVYVSLDSEGTTRLGKICGVLETGFEVTVGGQVRTIGHDELIYDTSSFIRNFIVTGKVGVYGIVVYEKDGSVFYAEYVYMDAEGRVNRVTFDKSGTRTFYSDLDPDSGYLEVKQHGN